MDVRKIKVLQGLQEGKTITEVCEEVGINRSTYYSWLNNDPDFKATKKDMEEKMFDNLYTVAMSETMDRLLKSNNDFYVLQCLQTVAKYKHAEKMEISNKPLSLEELLKDLDN